MYRELAEHSHHHLQSTNIKDGQKSPADTSPKEDGKRDGREAESRDAGITDHQGNANLSAVRSHHTPTRRAGIEERSIPRVGEWGGAGLSLISM